MNEFRNLILKVKESKLSDKNKRRILAGIMASVMLLSSSGCNIKDNIDFSNITIEKCIDLVSSLTNLDEFLEETNFYELNSSYIKAREEDDVKKISGILPKLYNLMLEGTIVDALIERGKINSIKQIKDIEIAKYEDEKIYCNIKYTNGEDKKMTGNISIGASVCKNLKLELDKNILNIWNDINDRASLSLIKADYGYRRCMELTTQKGDFTNNFNLFYLNKNSEKINALKNNEKNKLVKK